MLAEKIDVLIGRLSNCDLRTSVGVDKATEVLRLALKEQDRDTRHACAEAILKCSEDVSGECIWRGEAHDACMNVRAL